MVKEEVVVSPELSGSGGRIELQVSGMNCGNCVRKASEAVRGVAGVLDVDVDLGSQRVKVRLGGDVVLGSDRVVQALGAAGYPAVPVERVGDGKPDRAGRSVWQGWGVSVGVGTGFTLLLGWLEWGGVMGGHAGGSGSTWTGWAAFALALPVQWVCGGRFYRGAWAQLRQGATGMDVLVSLGSSTAFGFSVWSLLSGRGRHLFFFEAASILAFISVGHWLEAWVGARAEAGLRGLLELAPPRAMRLDAGGGWREVDVQAIVPGDCLLVRPGDRVAVDGQVSAGVSSVDESMLTGESVPVVKEVGSLVYGGSMNTSGRLEIRVTGVGEETALAQIVATVKRARASRASIQRLVDRISAVFVPVVIVVAAMTFLGWWLAYPTMLGWSASLATWLWPVHVPLSPVEAGVVHAAAVLIVACPCAMGLATPAAIMAGAHAAARMGVLLRDAMALEKTGRVDTVVFDKTGTVTRGRPQVVGVHVRGGSSLDAGTLRGLVQALAVSSSHPYSRALRDWVGTEGGGDGLTLRGILETAGRGTQGSWQGATGGELTVRLGSPGWLESEGVSAGVEVREWLAGAGQTGAVVGLGVGDQMVACWSLRDELDPGARDAVRELESRGLSVWLMTGDREDVAMEVGRALGVKPGRVLSGVRPEAKAERVASLQRAGHRVAFVGDGLNDAPALEQADLGIAVTRATDVARESADMVLLRGSAELVPRALVLASATLATIRQNLFWAFVYNTAAIPLAAMGLLSPAVCAVAMGLSDLLVLGNAWRLSRRG